MQRSCQENTVSIDWGAKRRRSQEKRRCQKIGMLRERDFHGKRLQRHWCQETAMTSEKTLSGEKSVSGLGLRSCQHEVQSRGQTGSRESGIIRKGCRGKEMTRSMAVLLVQIWWDANGIGLAGLHLLALDRSEPRRISSANSWSQWGSPDFNRRGSEPDFNRRGSERCGPRRTSTGEGRSAVGLAGLQRARVGALWASPDFNQLLMGF